MAKMVLFLSLKGGSGKSLCADELLFSLERTGIKYSFFDLDGQGGVIHKTREDANAEVVVIDTPGALQADMHQLIETADLIVIPTKLTGRDIKPLQITMDIVNAKSKNRVLYVLNGFNARYKAGNAFKSWFESLGDLDYVVLPQSEAYAQSAIAECSVMDVCSKTSYVGLMNMSMVNAVRRRLDLPEESW